MKRFYTTMLSLAAIASVASAQQLPNGDFEGSWTDCVPWTSKGNTTVKVGQNPESWSVSNVIGIAGMGKTIVGEKIAGHDSNSAVQLTNKYKMGQVIPGYITLGTAWNTSVLSGFSPDPATKDGGSFGGKAFAYRPDALSFYYKRSHGGTSTEKASVVAYIWKGTYTQENVPGEVSTKNPTTVTMEDRDRNILGIETSQGGAVTSDGCERIAKINYGITGDAAEWTNMVIPFEYESTNAPEKINVAFAAGDYFSTSPEKDNKLSVDNVKLIYYSRLASLKVGDKEIALKDGQYNYAIYSDYMAAPEDKSAFNAVCMGTSGSSTASVDYDKATGKAVITVTNSNEGGTDTDGEAQHIYTIEFKEGSEPSTVVETKTFYGVLNINMAGEPSDPIENTPVMLDKMSNGTYTLRLEKFGATQDEPDGLGDIIVKDITLTGDQLKGSADEIKLMGGYITASAELTGTYDGGDNISLTIKCIWVNSPDTPIDVTYNGSVKKEATVVETKTFYGVLDVKVGGETMFNGADTPVMLDIMSDGTYTLRLEKFGATQDDPDGMGDITVKDITLTGDQLKGTAPEIHIGTEITASAELTGTYDGGDNISLAIKCIWTASPDTPIDVTFNGTTTKPAPTVVETQKFEGVIEYGLNISTEVVPFENCTAEIDKMSDGTYTVRFGKFGVEDDLPDGRATISFSNVTLNGTELSAPATEAAINDASMGAIKTNATLTGSFDGSDLNMMASCTPVDESMSFLTFTVAFKGKLAAIGDIDADVDNSEAPVEYYNLQGVRCNPDNLTPGIYVRRQGKDVSKILVR